MADACINTVSPMYRAVQKTLQGDIEHLMQLMVDLEGRAIEDDCDVSVCEVSADVWSCLATELISSYRLRLRSHYLVSRRLSPYRASRRLRAQ